MMVMLTGMQKENLENENDSIEQQSKHHHFTR